MAVLTCCRVLHINILRESRSGTEMPGRLIRNASDRGKEQEHQCEQGCSLQLTWQCSCCLSCRKTAEDAHVLQLFVVLELSSLH